MGEWYVRNYAINNNFIYKSNIKPKTNRMKIYDSSKFNKLPDGILFDTDNTLYPYDPAHNAAFEALINKLSKNFSIEKNQFVKFYNEARKDVKERLGSTASSHSRLLYIQRMLEKMVLVLRF